MISTFPGGTENGSVSRLNVPLAVTKPGSVDIIRDTEDGIIKLSRLKPGAIFGEMALIDGSPRMATAVAVEATTVLMVKGEELQAKLD